MPVPAEISQLVELFERNIDQYRAPAFTEAAVRHQFIDPLFIALGWDVNNIQGFAEQYKEVIHEDKVRVAGAAKAPDYAFRIGKERKFFVEAKKPAVDIQYEIEPAYQLRRYAWSAKLPLSILTDFEELSVYDCRSKPAASDKASAGRILLLNYKEYVPRWDEIAGVFGKAAVWQGALDKYAEAKAGKRGTAQVDDEFLAEIERWRELLAHNLVLRNPSLRGRDVNWAVQQIIDRIVFLRICEARDLETFEQLRALLNGGRTYERLQELFLYADRRYNSGLFHFEVEKDRSEAPDTLTLGLAIDDKVLKDIIEHLYYPQSPYEFSVVPADILGHVYERFLGKVIRLTPGRQVKIEEKPEVRKAGGVYYTPTYIVDYIVRQTVGPLLEGKTPRTVGRSDPAWSPSAGGHITGDPAWSPSAGGHITGDPAWSPSAGGHITGDHIGSPLRILDPACGSGSFLLGAYQFLLDWHMAEYLKDPDRWLKGKRPPLERASGGITRLSIEERKRILMNNIYGVDIDPQAVEVTKLSLLLKVLEGEGVAAQMSFLPERVLPDLGRNIKCGNSLIGPDFYAGKLALPDEETAGRVNAFDWKTEFPDVFRPDRSSETCQVCGFDAVIGNPPYIRIQALQEWAPLEVEHYKRAYRAASKGNYDIYVVFVEKGLQLLNEHGVLGLILPHKFFNAQYGEPLRRLLSEGQHLSKVIHFGDQQVFEGATTYTCLLFLEKGGRKEFQFVRAHNLPAWRAGAAQVEGTIPAASAGPSEWNFVVGRGSDLFERLRGMPVKLGDICSHIFQGLVTSADPVYLLDPVGPVENGLITVRSKATGQEHQLEAAVCPPLCKGSLDIRRYRAIPSKRVLFPYDAEASAVSGRTALIPARDFAAKYPKAWAYLKVNYDTLRDREKGKMRHEGWYGYVYPKSVSLFARSKILTPSIAAKASFALDPQGEMYFVGSGGGGGGGYGILQLPDAQINAAYLVALLNSSLLDYIVKRVSSSFRGGYFAYSRQYIEQLPIRTIDFTDPADIARHDRMVALVTQMLDLHARLAAEGVPHEVAALQRRIETTDRQIDALVYELYGLTPEEIKVVEATEQNG
jgi:type I restriction-modification system DNA methylase subunit